MFHVIHLRQDGGAEIGGRELLEAPRGEGDLLWVDIEGREKDAEGFLKEQGVHSLAIEDTFTLDHQPKIESYEKFLFVILRATHLKAGEARIQTVKLAVFLGHGLLITYHRVSLPGVTALRQRLEEEWLPPRLNSTRLFYYLADDLIDRYFPVIDGMADQIEILEEQIFAHPTPQQLEQILEMRRRLSTMRRVMLPHRTVFGHLAAAEIDPRIEAQDALYFRDIHDNVFRLVDALDQQRDLLASTKDTYLSAVGQRTNDVMKVLTLFSALLLPLSVITGLYGMNFPWMPGTDSPYGFWAVLAVMVGLGTGLILWFRHKGWFQ